MPPSFRQRVRLLCAAGLALVGLACEQSARSTGTMLPTFPSNFGVPPIALGELAPQRIVGTFPLLKGTLTIQIRENGSAVGSIIGRYTGTASLSNSGRTSASLDPEVRRATGVATGLLDLDAEGTGAAFLGEGDFTLSLKLSGAEQSSGGAIQAKVSGTSTISCSDAGAIVVTLQGTGSTSRLGDLEVQLRHEIGNAGCG